MLAPQVLSEASTALEQWLRDPHDAADALSPDAVAVLTGALELAGRLAVVAGQAGQADSQAEGAGAGIEGSVVGSWSPALQAMLDWAAYLVVPTLAPLMARLVRATLTHTHDLHAFKQNLPCRCSFISCIVFSWTHVDFCSSVDRGGLFLFVGSTQPAAGAPDALPVAAPAPKKGRVAAKAPAAAADASPAAAVVALKLATAQHCAWLVSALVADAVRGGAKRAKSEGREEG